MNEAAKLFDLTGKVAIVTGGGSGLGRVFAEALAEFGADVSIVDVDEGGARETATIIENLGRKALVIRGDVANFDDVRHMAERTFEQLGRIDILVNNAGISCRPAKVADLPVEEWDRVMEVNLKGAFLCTKVVLPYLVKQKKGSIINIASILGLRSVFQVSELMPIPPYNVSKAGLIALTKETAVEYAREGIRVNCIAPGWHRGTKLTARWKGEWGEEELKEYETMIKAITPLGRRGELGELKGLVVFLASEASRFITGQVIPSDGGIIT